MTGKPPVFYLPIESPCRRRENRLWRERLMINTIVDGTFRQTNLTNESSEYLAKREELRLAEIALMPQRERVAELRRNLLKALLLRTINLKRLHVTSTLVTRLCAPSASANSLPSPIA